MAGPAPLSTAAEEISVYIRDNRAALDDGFALDVLSRGLPHLIRALDAIIDSIDSRLGDIEKRLDAAGVPRPDGGVGDGEEWQYFAFYTLTGDADYGKWEQGRRGWGGVPPEFLR